LWTAIIATFFVAMGIFFVFSIAPTKARRPIVWSFTFLAGGFYVLLFLWPTPVGRVPNQLPNDQVEAVSFWLADFQPRVADLSNILTAFLLGLGIFSVLRIHLTKLVKKQKDWGYSIVLLAAMVLMAGFSYTDWIQREFMPNGAALDEYRNWGIAQYMSDVLFDGFLQQMDAAMFSMIAFFILSAAYRAFRIRSVEATVLMASALILILSIMAIVEVPWANFINQLADNNPEAFINNLKISEIANWFRSTLQVPSLRALEFGVGLGALAMGLRLWLGLEKGGVS
jgi:uncharacterized membrane protein